MSRLCLCIHYMEVVLHVKHTKNDYEIIFFFSFRSTLGKCTKARAEQRKKKFKLVKRDWRICASARLARQQRGIICGRNVERMRRHVNALCFIGMNLALPSVGNAAAAAATIVVVIHSNCVSYSLSPIDVLIFLSNSTHWLAAAVRNSIIPFFSIVPTVVYVLLVQADAAHMLGSSLSYSVGRTRLTR